MFGAGKSDIVAIATGSRHAVVLVPEHVGNTARLFPANAALPCTVVVVTTPVERFVWVCVNGTNAPYGLKICPVMTGAPAAVAQVVLVVAVVTVYGVPVRSSPRSPVRIRAVGRVISRENGLRSRRPS